MPDKDEESVARERDPGQTEEGTEVDHNRDDSALPYDTGWAWMIVLGSFLMHTILIGYLKTFGILFVEIQDLFQLSSSMTAWITGIMQLTLNFFSPVANILSDHFSSRVVVMVGGFLQAAALFLSAFAQDLSLLIATAGVIFGIGASLTYGPTIIMVGYYFKRRLALANAISLSGSSVGQFVFPPLVTLLIDRYSIRGSLIILAGVMFNITLSGALLRPMEYYRRRKPQKGPTANYIEKDQSKLPLSDFRDPEISLVATSNQDMQLNSLIENSRCGHGMSDSDLTSSQRKSKKVTSRNGISVSETCRKYVIEKNGDFSEAKSYLQVPGIGGSLQKNGSLPAHLRPQFETLVYASNGDLFTSAQNVLIVENEEKSENSHETSRFCQRNTKCCHLQTWKKCLVGILDFKLLRNPVFLLFAISCTCSNFGYIGQYRYIPARAKDLGISEPERALLLSITGITDLVARLLVGFVADIGCVKKYVRRYRLLAAAMLLQGINSLLCPLSVNFTGFLIYAIFFGIFGGFYMTMVCVTLVDLLGRQHLSRAWGIMLLLYGLMSLGEPLILGKLRDLTGSYDMSFRACGIFFMVAAILIFCEQFALKYKDKCNKTKKVESEESIGLQGESKTT